MKSNLVAHCLAEVVPLEPSLGQFVGVAAPYKLLATLLSEFLKVDIVSPHREVSLHFFAAVTLLNLPNVADRLVFGTVEQVRELVTEAPQVEHAAKQLLSAETLAKLPLLNLHLNRLECPLVPLLDGDALSKLSKSLNNFHELLQCIVTLCVELAVLEELVHGFLLALQEHLFKQDEGQFGHKQLVMVSVVSLHLGTLSGDLLHTGVVCAVKLLQLRLQVVSFNH